MRLKIFFASIVLLGLPLVTSALTLSDLEQQLRFVANQIKTLQAQSQVGGVAAAAAGALSSSPDCPALTQELANGATGEEVTALQDFLIRKGEISRATFAQMPKGSFGHLTQVALESWQTQHNLLATGHTDAVTRQKIAQACNGDDLPVPEISFKVNKESVPSGEEVILSWQTKNATKCTVFLTPDGGTSSEATVALNGSFVLHPNISTKAQVDCADILGSDTKGPHATQTVSILVRKPVSFQNNAQSAAVLSALQSAIAALAQAMK